MSTMQINEENARRLAQGIGAMRPFMLARAEELGKRAAQICESMRPGLTRVGRSTEGGSGSPWPVDAEGHDLPPAASGCTNG